jgi:Zinc carboxypeptidase
MRENTRLIALTDKKGFFLFYQNLMNCILDIKINIHHITGVKVFVSLFSIMFAAFFSNLNGQNTKTGKPVVHSFQIPKDYLREPENIPSFWLTTVDEVIDFLKKNVHKGQVKVIGTSAGGRPIRAVFYGQPRQGKGTTTFSGSLGFGDVRAYRGPDHKKTVYLGIAAVHGGEFEGIVGIVNLISVIETGKDLRGKEWPEITAIVAQLDRLILIPIVNPDGRARIPLRMEAYRDTDFTVAEYLNTGGKPDGTITGWPQIKEFIPMDFTRPGFPGGYPNDAGVNIQHDDFSGKSQPETQALFNLAEREKPDLILNMHTGAVYMRMDRPLGEPALAPAFDTLFRYVHSALALDGLQYTKDPKVEGDPNRASTGVYNIDGALNFHCGALSVVVESPSHSFSGINEAGKPVIESPEMLLDAQLICHQEAMRFLAESGGRSVWTPGRKH